MTMPDYIPIDDEDIPWDCDNSLPDYLGDDDE